jgi:hypothetical protein
VIYGAPCQIVAAGTDRNLVQGAVVKRYGKDGRPERSEIETIERVLGFGQPLDKIKKAKEKEAVKNGMYRGVAEFILECTRNRIYELQDQKIARQKLNIYLKKQKRKVCNLLLVRSVRIMADYIQDR